MTSSIGGTGTTQQTGGIHSSAATATGTTGNAEMGKDAFLKLLVAQLKYQDPSSPTDSSQFMAQTAQFTMVEKLEELAKSQTDMLNASQLQSASSLVGRDIEWNVDGVAQSGKVSAMQMVNGSPTLLVGDKQVALAQVTKVA